MKKIDKASLLLLGLGVLLAAFGVCASSESSLLFLQKVLRQGRVLDEEVLFWFRDLRLKGLVFGVLLCLAAFVRFFWGERIRSFLRVSGNGEMPSLQGKSPVFLQAVDLFLVSALSLFAELLVIRWLAVEMRVFAYFKNVPLISCFLGIGLGAALGEKKDKISFYSFPFWFSLLAAVVVFLGPQFIFLNPAGSQEYIWGIGKTSSLATQSAAAFFFLAVMVFIFLWNTRIFMTLGYMIGRMLTPFSPLAAYSLNIAGSLAGVLLFGFLSYFSTPPIVWFAVTLLGFLFFLRRNRRQLVAMLLVSAAFLIYLGTRQEPHPVFWSPYYKITLIPSFIASKSTGEKTLGGYSLEVNKDSHQTGMNYSDEFVKEHREEADMSVKEVLELPFTLRRIRSALIVGSGMGNDVAAALRKGVEEIDAVEIDPVILELGKRFHPEKPYDSPRVRVVNDDARSFFKKCRRKYDIVVFGILDSHTQFSSLSSLRLDNYVYTLESFQDAKALLNPGGVLSLTFGGDARATWMGERFYRMLKRVFGGEPVALDFGRMMFVAGEDLPLEELARHEPWQKYLHENTVSYPADSSISLATDNWPFIYLKAKEVPKVYLLMIALLCLVSLGFLKRHLKDQREMSPHFFFLGAAFLLLETKAISELALVFGTTWTVNAIVISGIMVLILAANFLVQRYGLKNLNALYGLLALALVFSYGFSLSAFAGFSFWTKVFLSTFVALLPVFFASMIFAVSFSQTQHAPSAFGSNLIGAVIGGFVEYASLGTGIRSLALLALVFYGVSLAALRRGWRFRF